MDSPVERKTSAKDGRIKTLAEGEEAIVVIPPVIPIVEIELALVIPVVEVGDVAVAVELNYRALYAKYHLCHCPLSSLGAVFYLGSYPPVFCTKYLYF